MSTLYEIVELANGDIALQKEGDEKLSGEKQGSNRAPLVTMRFSTDLVRFLRSAKMDVAKVMVEAGLERVASLAESVSREEIESKMTKPTTFEINRGASKKNVDSPLTKTTTNHSSSSGSSVVKPATKNNSPIGSARFNSSSLDDRSSSKVYHNTNVTVGSQARNSQARNGQSKNQNSTNHRTTNHRTASSLRASHDAASEMDEQHPTVSHLLH